MKFRAIPHEDDFRANVRFGAGSSCSLSQVARFASEILHPRLHRSEPRTRHSEWLFLTVIERSACGTATPPTSHRLQIGGRLAAIESDIRTCVRSTRGIAKRRNLNVVQSRWWTALIEAFERDFRSTFVTFSAHSMWKDDDNFHPMTLGLDAWFGVDLRAIGRVDQEGKIKANWRLRVRFCLHIVIAT